MLWALQMFQLKGIGIRLSFSKYIYDMILPSSNLALQAGMHPYVPMLLTIDAGTVRQLIAYLIIYFQWVVFIPGGCFG